MKYFSPAKLNLCIDVIKKDTSGYHKIRTVITEYTGLQDEIIFTPGKEFKNMSIEQGAKNALNSHPFPNSQNIIDKAICLIKTKFRIKKNMGWQLIKRIPFRSGLGGGSSNAATTLKALNQIWELNLTQNELANLGKELGMDVPFFIYGGTVLATNYGEKIKKLPDIKNIDFTLLPAKKWPKIKVKENKNKTEEMYLKLDLSKCDLNKHKTKELIKAINKEDTTAILKNIHNDFETLIKVPKFTHLSGSGPALFKTEIAPK